MPVMPSADAWFVLLISPRAWAKVRAGYNAAFFVPGIQTAPAPGERVRLVCGAEQQIRRVRSVTSRVAIGGKVGCLLVVTTKGEERAP